MGVEGSWCPLCVQATFVCFSVLTSLGILPADCGVLTSQTRMYCKRRILGNWIISMVRRACAYNLRVCLSSETRPGNVFLVALFPLTQSLYIFLQLAFIGALHYQLMLLLTSYRDVVVYIDWCKTNASENVTTSLSLAHCHERDSGWLYFWVIQRQLPALLPLWDQNPCLQTPCMLEQSHRVWALWDPLFPPCFLWLVTWSCSVLWRILNFTTVPR